MDQTELFVAVLVAALALGVLASTISSYIAVEFFHRHTKFRLARQEADTMLRNEMLEEQRELQQKRINTTEAILVEQSMVQLNRDNELRVREEAVTVAEHQLAQRTAQAVTALHATKELLDDDTTIMDLDQQWLPELRDQLNDTVMLPRIEEEL